MSEDRITQAAYDELLATTSITDLDPTAALNFLGTLVNHSHDHNDDRGARHAIQLANELPIATWPPAIRAYAYYDLANAYDEVRRHEQKQHANAWTWGPAFDQGLLYLRKARNDDGFKNSRNDDDARSSRTSATP